MFVGKGFIDEGLFKLNILSRHVNNILSSSVVLNTECCDIWHGRLGHVNLGSIKKMINMWLIPKANIYPKSKCQFCVQAKQPRKSFKFIEDRYSDHLQLIHSDVMWLK